MGIYDYDWEPYQITTEDGYTLTLMNVTKKTSAERVTASLNPLLMVPAMGCDPAFWLQSSLTGGDTDNALFLKLLDAGHD